MNRSTLLIVQLFTVAALTTAIAIAAEPAKDSKPAGQPEFKLPPGWTQADLQKCMEACTAAATPGKMHGYLAKSAGTWQGKNTMWPLPGADPIKSECTATVTTLMDGRFIQVAHAGEMPGMGPYHGLGTFGFDNVTQKFVGTWLDNCGTGMMTGTGELSPDGKTLTWTYTFNCPVEKKPATMRQVDTLTGDNTRTMELFMPDMKTGKEFQMLRVEFTKK